MSAFAADADRHLLQMDGVLPHEVLKESPSCKHGISPSVEYQYRAFGCEVIREAADYLKLSPIGTSTAQNIFHRFYYRKSLCEFDVFGVAMGSVLVGSKAVDAQLALRDILAAFFAIFSRRTNTQHAPQTNLPLSVGSEQYIQWKSELSLIEMHILKELGFCLYAAMNHPHRYVVYLLNELSCEVLRPVAIAYANDSMCTDCALRYGPPAVAAACLYLAARTHDNCVPLPAISWYKAFDVHNLEHLQEIAEKVLSARVEREREDGRGEARWLDPVQTAGKIWLFRRERAAGLSTAPAAGAAAVAEATLANRAASTGSSEPVRRSRFAAL